MSSPLDIYIYEMSRNDYTVPTRCRHRGGMVDTLGCKAEGHQLADQPSNQILDYSVQNHPKPVSFLSSGVSSGPGLTNLNPTIDHTYICIYIYIYIYTADTSGVNRLASQICHNRLFHKKLQQNLLHMISTEVSSLAAHNSRHIWRQSSR
jgi:hypothetical protein